MATRSGSQYMGLAAIWARPWADKTAGTMLAMKKVKA
jgi:hypothetical protein